MTRPSSCAQFAGVAAAHGHDGPGRPRARTAPRGCAAVSPADVVGVDRRTETTPSRSIRATTSSCRATTISAAADGVGARRSATKSAIVTSVSCPTAEIVGTGQPAIARATTSSLNAQRSSIDPPPRPTMTTSTPPTLPIAVTPARCRARRRHPAHASAGSRCAHWRSDGEGRG